MARSTPRRYDRHTPAQRIVLVVNSIVIVLCLLGAAALLIAKHNLDNRTQVPTVAVNTTTAGSSPGSTPSPNSSGSSPDATTGDTTPPTFPPADPRALNFLVAGEANNACVSPDSPWAGAADKERGEAELSDTIMVIRIDPATNRAAVLSFPRDLWVTIAGRGSKQRINTAYRKNDDTVLSQTIYENFGIVVDHYIQIDFCAFKSIVDAVGGVQVPFDVPIRDQNVNLLIPSAGCHRFVGDEALAYVRSRKLQYQDTDGEWRSDLGDDRARVARQQDFIRRVMKAALDKGLYNPSVARALLDNLTNGKVVTDNDLNVDKLLEFAGVMRNIDPAGLSTYQIASKGVTVRGGQQVLEPQLGGGNMQAILAIFQGNAPLAGAPVQDPSVTTIAPSGSTAEPNGPTTTTAAVVVGPEERFPTGIIPSKTQVC
jgi:LCP family protein required for cell wall assembly